MIQQIISALSIGSVVFTENDDCIIGMAASKKEGFVQLLVQDRFGGEEWQLHRLDS